MERLKKVMQENPVAAMVGAAFFGAAAYQAYKSVFCDDENATSLQEAETQVCSSRKPPNAISQDSVASERCS